jgi:hypothetical protein
LQKYQRKGETCHDKYEDLLISFVSTLSSRRGEGDHIGKEVDFDFDHATRRSWIQPPIDGWQTKEIGLVIYQLFVCDSSIGNSLVFSFWVHYLAGSYGLGHVRGEKRKTINIFGRLKDGLMLLATVAGTLIKVTIDTDHQ